jgi:hypothetical protein
MRSSKIAACSFAGVVAMVLSGAMFAVGLTSETGCNPKSCEEATNAMRASIDAVCAEPEFKDTPFCACCVPAGFYSIEDTCTCKALVLDADFCFYADGSAGYPQVRSALQYAASVCENRTVRLPYGDSGPSASCRAPAADASPPPEAGPIASDSSTPTPPADGAGDAAGD